MRRKGSFFKVTRNKVSVLLVLVGVGMIFLNYYNTESGTNSATEQADVFLNYVMDRDLEDSDLGEGLGNITEDQEAMEIDDTTMVLDIPFIDLRLPITHGTGENMWYSVGIFEESEPLGEGNFSLAGHSHPVYDSLLNPVHDLKLGQDINIFDSNGEKHHFVTYSMNVVDENALYVLSNFDDTRVTIVTCTRDGKERLIVVGKKMTEDERAEFLRSVSYERVNSAESYLTTQLDSLPASNKLEIMGEDVKIQRSFPSVQVDKESTFFKVDDFLTREESFIIERGDLDVVGFSLRESFRKFDF